VSQSLIFELEEAVAKGIFAFTAVLILQFSEHASLVLHQRNIIVLYGGRNNGQNLNDFHIYKIENKLWIQI
jgi:hypothetical protein